MSSIRTPIRVGVLYEGTQMTDLAGLDLLGNLTPQTINLIIAMNPQFASMAPHAIPMSFLYISSTMDPAQVTPDMYVRPTHTYATAPRDLDILLLGGPNPATVHEDSLVFLKEASKQTKVILTTCTGGMWLARSGVLEGKKATTNRVMLGMAQKMFPGTEWVDRRWVVGEGWFDGAEIWTAGGAGCGIDMFIEYTYQNFDKKMVEFGCVGLDFDFEGRSEFYKGALPDMTMA
ncbi:hypothetical protein J4E93_000101 [Alternaria ventricosa]|uniref:uncharacterized protein n=1 Tax=Alternaria ventricosa TaxID=1187951 RepID=UPI0020C527AC|nr:uncharacterized protein J4E93_000101 [Alternaria ventricosa]KAI4655389.1 hypothetical protein J4E93_000101 [Alternaria ventricosa]